MSFTAIALHIGTQLGYQNTKRIIEMPKSIPPVLNAPLEKDEDFDFMGKAADVKPQDLIASYHDTPRIHQLTGMLFVGISTEIKKLIMVQLNLYSGMNVFNEKYFALPIYGGGELMAGIILKRFLFGALGGFEAFGYQTRLIETLSQAKEQDQEKAIEYQLQPALSPSRFQNIFGGMAFLVGGFFGYQITPYWRATLRAQAIFPLKKEEKYSIQYKIDGKGDPFAAKHTMAYSIGMRATIGIEWIKNLKKGD